MRKNDGFVRSLEKAILLLEILSQKPEDVDLATLARTADMPKSTTLRLLATLKKHNFIQQDKTSRRFNLGWTLIALGKSAEKSFSLLSICHPFLEELVNLTGESASLSIVQGDHLVYIDQISSNNLIKGIPTIGASLFFHCSSSGKAFLSTLNTEEQDQYIREIDFVKKTDHTITDPALLKKELVETAEKGYAVDDEETELGGRCVASPIFNVQRKGVAAISIIGPTSRIGRNDFPRFGKFVAETTAKISKILGYEA